MVIQSNRKNNQKVEVDWFVYYQKYEMGKTLNEIARELNCSYQCVAKNFRRRNLKIRSLSEAGLISSKINRGCHNDTRETIKYKNRRILKSHYVWCIKNNMLIVPKGTVVHHIDHNKYNNNPDNLILLPEDVHKSLHYHIELAKNPNRVFWGINQNRESLGGGYDCNV